MSKFARFLRIISIALIAWGATFIPQKTFADEQEDCEMMAPDYYWDGTTCISYQEECESSPGYYWDGATCYSEEEQCSMQGADYYWDGTQCVENEEEDTCEADYGPGWWYDDTSGQCLDENGCAVDEEYDDGVCHEPCSDGEEWNGASCESVCSDGEEWNGALGSCESVCSDGEEWDGTECVSVCDEANGEEWDGSACVCDTSNNYYGTTGSCEYCDVSSGNFTWNNGTCTPVCSGNNTNFEYNGQCIENKFQITTTASSKHFFFNISAAGEFYIDCGTGGNFNSTGNQVGYLNKNNTTDTFYMCLYQNAGTHIVKFGGKATEYNSDINTQNLSTGAAISFMRTNGGYTGGIASISGSLGQIFSTIGSGGTLATQPRFTETFLLASMNGPIPENLFSGISGSPVPYMFSSTFSGCSRLTGSIPENLFSGISGAPAQGMFSSTFYGCSGLTGSIPSGLFSGISGAPAESMFHNTFYRCTGLTGSIPSGLFSGISGTPAESMFAGTFEFCSGLTGSIPSGLFGNISGTPASSMFSDTFYYCSGLTGSIPSGLFSGISGAPAESMFQSTFYGCTGLTGSIPSGLFGNISGAPAKSMFSSTFSGCSGLTGLIPSGLFSGISGAPAQGMFSSTFYGCSGLTGSIPSGLFSGISGAPAGSMFQSTFNGCRGLTGSIPSGLFSGISGAPAGSMFSGTFYGCSGLTGSIPSGLFSGISGAPAGSMFSSTFLGCSGLTGSIPSNLFGNLSGAPAQYMFSKTFDGCSGLTRFTDGSNTTNYIPGTFLSGINTDTYVTPQASAMFRSTGLASTCPANTYDVTRQQFNDAGKPWCQECPAHTTSPAGSTSASQCVCDELNNYYGTAGSCTYCNTSNGYTWDGSSCVCESPYIEEDGFCHEECQPGYDWDGSICALSCGIGEIDDGEGNCICDESSDYYGDAGSCEYCDTLNTGYYWDSENNSCESTCNEANGEWWNGMECEYACDTGYEWMAGGCQSICSDGEWWNGSECEYDCGEGATWSAGGCNCDEGSGYYGAPPCIYCDVDNGYEWDGSSCVCNGQEDDGVCHEPCDIDFEIWDSTSQSCVKICPDYSSSATNGMIISNGSLIIEEGVGIPLNNACIQARMFVQDPGIFLQTGDPSDIDFDDNNVSMMYCVYNPSTSDYDYACTQKMAICSANEASSILQMNAFNKLFAYVDLMGYTESDLANPASLFAYTPQNAPLYERCSVSSVCPAHSTTLPSGPIAELPGAEIDVDDNGEIALNECVAARVYGSLGGILDSEMAANTGLSWLYNLMVQQDTFDSTNALNQVDAPVEVAFCFYNENTGNYDGPCSPAVTICTDSNSAVQGFISAGASTMSQANLVMGLLGANMSALTPQTLSQIYPYTGSTIQAYDICDRTCEDGDEWFDWMEGCVETEEHQCESQDEYHHWVDDSCEYCDPTTHTWDGTNCVEDSTVCGAGEVDDGTGICVCDTGINYYGDAGSCEYCDPETHTWNGSACVLNCGEGEVDNGNGGCECDTANNYYGDAGSCEYCDVNSGNYEWRDGDCVSTSLCGDDIEYNSQCYDSKFQLTTTNTTDSFSFKISAAGEFYIDCGAGGNFNSTGNQVGYLNRNNTTQTTYTCTWTNADSHVIKFGGAATGYSTDSNTAAITFNIVSGYTSSNTPKIAGISGSLGAIFGTVSNPSTGQSQPRFYQTFYNAWQMTGSIPSNLFSGISGTPTSYMFDGTFYFCHGLTGSIPSGLFGNLSGAPAESMFEETFYYCRGLTGSIPSGLFGNISGTPASSMFSNTFYYCSGLTGSIPSGLFGNLSGTPASSMFSGTFYGCTGLTGSIPSGLFGNISGAPASNMFGDTFRDCSGLTGYIPANLFSGISGAPAESMFASTFSGCSGLTGSIPSGLFGNISGAPASNMFGDTFGGCSGLTGSIPSGLFGNLSGTPASGMFSNTFTGCSGLTGSIPSGLFGNLSGTPAEWMFGFTFFGCSGLTGSIPSGLFGNISGAPASNMFFATFYGCYGLTGSIPSGLFGNLSGAPAANMFNETFAGCSGLTGSIPSGLFGNLSGAPAEAMFLATFQDAGISGSIPSNLFSGISGAPAESMFENTFDGCNGLTGFTDGTNTTTYVPADFLADINTNTSVSEQVPRMFRYTQLDNSCPANTYDVTRQQFNDAGKPWCSPCPSGTHYTSTGATSVNQCCSEGYDWDGTQCSVLSVIDLTWIVDNQTYDTSTCTVNDLVTLPEEPTKDGYTFMGWTLQQEAPLE